MRLIDADALKTFIKQNGYLYANTLDTFTTVDVEHVVHCGECIYRNKIECPAYRKLVGTSEIITPPYIRFCSCGERKETTHE